MSEAKFLGKCKYCGEETNILYGDQEDAAEAICDPCYRWYVSDSDE